MLGSLKPGKEVSSLIASDLEEDVASTEWPEDLDGQRKEWDELYSSLAWTRDRKTTPAI